MSGDYSDPLTKLTLAAGPKPVELRRRRTLYDAWPQPLRVVAGAVAFVCGILGLLTSYAAVTLPDVNTLGAMTGSVRVLDRHGELVAQIGRQGMPHLTVSLRQVAPVMQAATLAAEDRSFYSEGAFDLPRILKAMAVDIVTGSASEGASTITQQLAKNAFLNSDKTVIRKLREALLANQINARYSKRQILELYLNTIYYGNGAFGVEEAAESYFGIHASQLDLRKASLLAGLPQAPSYDDPFVNPEAAFSRQHYVLAAMVASGVIGQADADAADPTVAPPARSTELASLRHGATTQNDQAPAFAQYVRDELGRLLGNDSYAFTETLTVTTTLDLSAQRAAQRAVTGGIASLGRGSNNGALLMLDARTGGIEAMVGSADYGKAAIAGQFNVTTGQRQEGSTFKPYVYATAFAEGRLRPNTLLSDTAEESARLGGVHDFDDAFLGRLPADESLLLSRNVPAEEAMYMAGVDNVIGFAHALGISAKLAPNLSTAIGTSAVSMIDQAAAYSAFANGGYRVQPHAVLRVTDAQGNVLLDQSAGGRGGQVMSSELACTMDSILRRYPATWGIGFDRPTAGKSGTTDNFRDAWYMAYTPDWVVATWAGHTNADGTSAGMQSVYGVNVGSSITVPFVASLPYSDSSFCASAAGPPKPAKKHGEGGGG